MIRALLCGLVLAGASFPADYPRTWFLNAHNCYPEHGRGADRLERARRAGLASFEIDLGWSPARQRTVITHDPKKLDGDEPTLEDYFFAPMLPELERSGVRVLLLLDFKTDHPSPVKDVHRWLLSRRRDLLTTFDATVEWRPLTVLLTGNARAIEAFEKLVRENLPGDGQPPAGVERVPRKHRGLLLGASVALLSGL